MKLDRADIDWAQCLLLVRESKSNESRYTPVHDSRRSRSTHIGAMTCADANDVRSHLDVLDDYADIGAVREAEKSAQASRARPSIDRVGIVTRSA
jgi:hypothetical protein